MGQCKVLERSPKPEKVGEKWQKVDSSNAQRCENGSNTKIKIVTVNGIKIVQEIKSYFFEFLILIKREVEEKMSVERHYQKDLCTLCWNKSKRLKLIGIIWIR